MTAPAFVRIRPVETDDQLSWENGTISVNSKTFSFPRGVISPEMNQETLAQTVELSSMLQDFISGVNVNFLAYGQTGSGKTYSIFGPPGIMSEAGSGKFGTEIISDYGLFPRIALKVVDMLSENQSLEATAGELQWDSMLDLANSKAPCQMDKTKPPYKAVGMRRVILKTRSDVLNYFKFLAERNTASTLLNDTSSRSHAFAALWLTTYNATDKTIQCNKLQFVDLAGSERLNDAHNGEKESYAEMVTGMTTNFSLAMLSQNIRMILEKGINKVPQGATLMNLVALLRASMNGTARSAILVCLNPSPANHGQSINALDFGNIWSQLPMEPRLTRPRLLSKILAEQRATKAEAEAAIKRKVKGKFGDVRKGQLYTAETMIERLSEWEKVKVAGGVEDEFM